MQRTASAVIYGIGMAVKFPTAAFALPATSTQRYRGYDYLRNRSRRATTCYIPLKLWAFPLAVAECESRVTDDWTGTRAVADRPHFPCAARNGCFPVDRNRPAPCKGDRWRRLRIHLCG